MYAFVLYRSGPHWDSTKPLSEQSAVREHIAFLERLLAEGVIELAGPFHKGSDLVSNGLVGCGILQTDSLENAREWFRQDPAVLERVLDCEVLPWYP